MYERLGMEWRLLRNVYKNHIPNVQMDSTDHKNLDAIASKCESINSAIQQGLNGLGKPNPNADVITNLMASIIKLDSELGSKPELSKRTPRLVGITNSILVGNYSGILQDAQGNHADWYAGL